MRLLPTDNEKIISSLVDARSLGSDMSSCEDHLA